MTLVSRDCCPCLNDYDPGYSVAAPAVLNATSRPKNTVSWDQRGPLCDRPSKIGDGERSASAKAEPTEAHTSVEVSSTNGKQAWTKVGKFSTKPRKLTLHGTTEIFHRLQDVKMAKSPRTKQ